MSAYKKYAAYMMKDRLLSWQDQMYLIFNSVEILQAKDNIDAFTGFFLLCIFLIIENAYIDHFWKQAASGIYKIRLQSKFKVWSIKYVFSILGAIKYYAITFLVCCLWGRGRNSILNLYDDTQTLMQPLIFLIMFSMISLSICSVLNRTLGVLVMTTVTFLSAFFNHFLLIGNFGMYIRTQNCLKAMVVFSIMAIFISLLEFFIKQIMGRYIDG